MPSSNDKLRVPMGVSGLTAGATLTGGGVAPVKGVHTKTAHVVRHKIEVPSLTFTVTAAVGGAADGQGQRICVLPVGKWLVLGAAFDLDVTTQAGLSGTVAVVSVGTAAAADATATLTTTRADLVASTTLGTLTAATTHNLNTHAGVNVTPAGSITADTDVFLNLAATTFVHASLTSVTLAVSGTVELYLVDLGDV